MTAQQKILVIEDDRTIRLGIETVLKKDGYAVYTASSGEDGIEIFQDIYPKLVITDLKLPGISGMELLDFFKSHPQKSEIILISAYGTVDIAVQALKNGARDFIAKPFSIDELRLKVNRILNEIQSDNDTPTKETQHFHGIVGTSAAMDDIKAKVKNIAKVPSPVLIMGESGTGKELIARAIHHESDRSDRVFLAVNCGALTESLLESELFGHEEGAFTGAIRRHKGVFERADQGTILLDEIGEISPRMQVKLLRVLQDQVFHRVGGTKEIVTDTRIIASTNKNLREAIHRGEFREDLYFRLNVIPIHVPPLRERIADIPELVQYISERKSEKIDKPFPACSNAAMLKLQRYTWPGNIRELENFLERLLIFTNTDEITENDIYFDDSIAEDGAEGQSLNEVLENTELRMIRNALQNTGGVKQQAAKLLGINTSTLYYKMEKYGISDEETERAG